MRDASRGEPLVLEGAVKSYKTHFWQRPVVSLAGLDLRVRKGEILGLLGPNGAGKTTTIKLALGLIFPDEGRVVLMGRPASDPAARARVGYLPETPNFPDDLSARELVEFAGRLHGLDAPTRRRRARELLELVGIGHVGERALRKFSKGMVQRAGMARALIGEPEFVILDEPMSGLDPIGRREFRDLILGLKERGITVLFASHVLSDAEMLCDRVAILERGRLLATEDLGALAGERRVLHWEVEVELPAAADDATLPAFERASFVARRGSRALYRFEAALDAESILGLIAAAGARPLSIVPHRETLEDLFLRRVGDAKRGQGPPQASAEGLGVPRREEVSR